MRLALAILLQALALFCAWLAVPATLLAAGMLSMLTIAAASGIGRKP